ncbi:hypothetical protein ACHWQZ_G008950 [Mnemiopsis leidyi]
MPLEEGKVPLKSVRHSLERFKESLPQLYTRLGDHVEKIRTAKQAGDIRSLNREQIAASKTFKNLKQYLKELDQLESKIFFSDLEKFKLTADPLRELAYEEIVKFVKLDDNLDKVNESDLKVAATQSLPEPCSSDIVDYSTHPEHKEAHPELISLQKTKCAEEDLKQLEATAESWNQLQQDIQDVAEIMTNLSKLVQTQGENINTIEQNVEKAQVETRQGLLEIIRARRAKFASVPVAGAVVGCIVGGPLGMLVGFKVAGVVTAALGTFVGYKSGKYFRNRVNEGLEEEPVPGMLVAPTIGVYEEEGDGETGGDFQQFGDEEIRASEEYKPYRDKDISSRK